MTADRRTHSCTKKLSMVGAVVCKLRGLEEKDSRQRSSLSAERSVSFESLLRNFNGNINWDFGKISAQPHPTLYIQFLNRENNDKSNALSLGKQICFTIVWGFAETLQTGDA